MPLRYKRSRPASSVAAGNRPIAHPSTASPPPTAPVRSSQAQAVLNNTPVLQKGKKLLEGQMLARPSRAPQHACARYKRSRPASSVAAGNRPIAHPSTASPPPTAPDADDTNMEEGNPTPFPGFCTSSSAGTSGASPSFQGAFNLSHDEVLA
ncbi:hypothetical protein JCGZ_03553 [Jatropha curcas]|uniref:Uncharacterized protein n=1 Tax=Jatropha curcas TaxID=180498 RepID=A0A067KXS6_JATCU|nr:hypothetical protein JCGZ_03553 [Jatropha curcas]